MPPSTTRVSDVSDLFLGCIAAKASGRCLSARTSTNRTEGCRPGERCALRRVDRARRHLCSYQPPPSSRHPSTARSSVGKSLRFSGKVDGPERAARVMVLTVDGHSNPFAPPRDYPIRWLKSRSWPRTRSGVPSRWGNSILDKLPPGHWSPSQRVVRANHSLNVYGNFDCNWSESRWNPFYLTSCS